MALRGASRHVTESNLYNRTCGSEPVLKKRSRVKVAAHFCSHGHRRMLIPDFEAFASWFDVSFRPETGGKLISKVISKQNARMVPAANAHSR